jgi:proline dehydrogenase
MIRSILISLSQSKVVERFVLSNRLARRASRRFVAGEELADALEAARALNQAGMKVSLDFLGENATTREDAVKAREMYLGVFHRIADEKLDANVSLKLTQLGIDFGEEFCQAQAEAIVEHAAALGNFVRVDMEGSAYTERTVQMTRRLREKNNAVGTVIQSYLYRSEKDIAALLEVGCRIRLCKGAYLEPPEIAYPDKRDVDANYVKLMKILLSSGIYHGIATHDPAMIAAAIDFAAKNGIGKEQFEFQPEFPISTLFSRKL